MTFTTYHDQKARIVAGDDRKTFGDFRSWVRICADEAAAAGRDFAPRQRTVAKLFHVSFGTAKNWFQRAYRLGLLKPIVQRIRLADGTFRRIANKYVVARTIRFRLVLARRWRELNGGTAEPIPPPAQPPKPQKTAVSPYDQFSSPLKSAQIDHLPFSQNDLPAEPQKRSFWVCSYDRCKVPNAWPAPSCRQCRSAKPFHAERIVE